jgi:hypothetical protein
MRRRSKVRAGLACGFRLASSRDDGRHSRAIAHRALAGAVKRGPLARRSNNRASIERKMPRGSTSGGSETDSGVPTSDKESVRGRGDSVKAERGPRKSRGLSASSALKRRRTRGAPKRNRPKLVTLIALPILLLPDHANGRDRSQRAPETKRRWRKQATAS